jgi:hypothetical protein
MTLISVLLIVACVKIQKSRIADYMRITNLTKKKKRDVRKWKKKRFFFPDKDIGGTEG